MIILLSAIAALLLFVHLVFNYNGTARMIKQIPGPPGRFIVGNGMDALSTTPAKLFALGRRYAGLYKDLYSFWAFPLAAVNIYNPEDIEVIVSNSKHNDKSRVMDILKPWLQEGLLLSKGSKWLQRRKILTPAFHFTILREFCKIFEENSQRLTCNLKTQQGRITTDVIPLISEYTLQSMCETSMGTRLNAEQTDEGRAYKRAIYELGSIAVDRFVNIVYLIDFIFNLTSSGKRQKIYLENVKRFTMNVIHNRKKMVENHGMTFNENIDENEEVGDDIYRKNRTAMLDLLITAEKDGLIDHKGIQEEIDTFMFEGHDTTASGLTYMLMLLANDINVQGNIVSELEEIFGDSKRTATMQDLSKMKYIECCIKESLRLYPPVPMITRDLGEDIKMGGYMVAAGTMCHIHIFDLHRREDLYENAENFIPERFLPENCIGRHPYAFIPFSAGARNCIGQKFAMLEMKSAVSSILRKYELHPVTKPSDITLVADIVLRNEGPVFVKFVERMPPTKG